MKENKELEHRCNVLVQQVSLFGFTAEDGFDKKWYVKDHRISELSSGERVSTFSTRRTTLGGKYCKLESGTVFNTYFDSERTVISHLVVLSTKSIDLVSKIKDIESHIESLNLPKPVLVSGSRSDGSIAINIIGFSGNIQLLDQLDILRVIASTEEFGPIICREILQFI